MNYELAKKLKDAGFPQRQNEDNTFGTIFDTHKFLLRENADSRDSPYDSINDRTMWIQYFNPAYVKEMAEFVVYVPTLSELIEACGVKGTQFTLFGRDKDRWEATNLDGFDLQVQTLTKYGSTPEEAVANLWIALNTK